MAAGRRDPPGLRRAEAYPLDAPGHRLGQGSRRVQGGAQSAVCVIPRVVSPVPLVTDVSPPAGHPPTRRPALRRRSHAPSERQSTGSTTSRIFGTFSSVGTFFLEGGFSTRLRPPMRTCFAHGILSLEPPRFLSSKSPDSVSQLFILRN